MLAHLGAGRGDHQRGDRRDVDAAQTVPTGAAGVDDLGAGGRSSRTPWATMARTNPVISSVDSPFACRAVASAAICAAVASPERTCPSTTSASTTSSDVAREQAGQDSWPASERGERRPGSCCVRPVASAPSGRCDIVSPTRDRARAPRAR